MSGVQLSERHLHPEQKTIDECTIVPGERWFSVDRDIVCYWVGFRHIPIIFVLGLFDFV